jgi:prepilin peptidase CpaA
MFTEYLAMVLAALLAVLLVAAAISDLKWRIIDNDLNFAIAALAVAYWAATGLSPWPDLVWQVGIALIVFMFFAGLNFVGGMGGGDVKMAGAMALWIPVSLILPTLTVMALAGGVISAAMVVHKYIGKKTAQPEVPYGVAIAIGGLWALHQQYLNQFSVIGHV